MADTYIHRTLGTPTSSTKYTFSTWLKRSTSAAEQAIISAGTSSSNGDFLVFRTTDQLEWQMYHGSNTGILKTNRLFRDYGAWYHIVITYDSANAVAGDRMKMYVNGVEEGSVGGYETDTNPPQDTASYINSAVQNNIGYDTYGLTTSAYFNGALAHTHLCDGQAYAASDFGETDSTSGIWVPKTGPSLTYGNNGFFLKYSSGATLTDSSGNGNNFTLGGGTLTAIKDTPSNNWCSMNPLEENNNNTQTFSNANSTVVITSGYAPVGSNLSVSKGKWYAECHCDTSNSSGDLNIMLGINGSYNMINNNTLGYSAYAYGFYLYNGYMLNNNTGNSNTGGTQYWTSPGGGIVDDNKYWALALDCDNNKLYVRLEGTWLESADPSAGTGGFSITAPGSTPWGCYRFANGIYFGGTNTFKWNFGNGFFGTTSAGASNADSDGYGVFKYSVPTGFKALCTDQLATYG